jgi:hypothetical protein
MKIVAIHQPNFLPWMGYFDKICAADIFIFLPTSGGRRRSSRTHHLCDLE